MGKKEILIFEARRQAFHIGLGLTLLFAIYTGLVSEFLLLLAVIAGIGLSFYCRNHELPIISHFLDSFEREKERKRFPGKGTIFFFLGVLMVYSLKIFPTDILYASILILTFGDSFSHIIGRLYGSTRNPLAKDSAKLLEGTIGGIIIAALMASLFVRPGEAIIASIVAMFAEAVELRINKNTIDDNLVVPLVAAFTLLILRSIF